MLWFCASGSNNICVLAQVDFCEGVGGGGGGGGGGEGMLTSSNADIANLFLSKLEWTHPMKMIKYLQNTKQLLS